MAWKVTCIYSWEKTRPRPEKLWGAGVTGQEAHTGSLPLASFHLLESHSFLA